MTPDEAVAHGVVSSRLRRIARWTFVNRRTGGVTVAQCPNVALWVFIALSIARRFCRLPVLRDHLFARSMGPRRVRFDRLER
jgi:hypothetical protein